MITDYENRAIKPRVGIGKEPVRITKSIPGHPQGTVRYPTKAIRERWLKMGVAEPVKPIRKGRAKASA